MITKYVKKPIPIDACQWIGTNFDELKNFCSDALKIDYPAYDESIQIMYIQTLEGKMYFSEGDYIIRGPFGEFYPCRKDVFENTYEVVE